MIIIYWIVIVIHLQKIIQFNKTNKLIFQILYYQKRLIYIRKSSTNLLIDLIDLIAFMKNKIKIRIKKINVKKRVILNNVNKLKISKKIKNYIMKIN